MKMREDSGPQPGEHFKDQPVDFAARAYGVGGVDKEEIACRQIRQRSQLDVLSLLAD